MIRELLGAPLRILIICITLTLCSCSSSLSRKVSIEGYDNLSIMGMSGAKIDLDLRNESSRKIKVKELQLTLREGDRVIGKAVLKEEVELPKRTPLVTQTTLWRFEQINVIAALAASKRLFDNDKNATFTVDIEGRAKISLATREFEQRGVPLRTILNEIK